MQSAYSPIATTITRYGYNISFVFDSESRGYVFTIPRLKMYVATQLGLADAIKYAERALAKALLISNGRYELDTSPVHL